MSDGSDRCISIHRCSGPLCRQTEIIRESKHWSIDILAASLESLSKHCTILQELATLFRFHGFNSPRASGVLVTVSRSLGSLSILRRSSYTYLACWRFILGARSRRMLAPITGGRRLSSWSCRTKNNIGKFLWVTS